MTIRRIAAAALALGLGLAAAAPPALAREIDPIAKVRYYLISEDEEVLTAADADSRTEMADGRVRVDVVFIYAAAPGAKPDQPADGHVYYLATMEFDCRGGQGWRSYARARATPDGAVLGRETGYTGWSGIRAGSVSDYLSGFACKTAPPEEDLYFTGRLSELRAQYLSHHGGGQKV